MCNLPSQVRTSEPPPSAPSATVLRGWLLALAETLQPLTGVFEPIWWIGNEYWSLETDCEILRRLPCTFKANAPTRLVEVAIGDDKWAKEIRRLLAAMPKSQYLPKRDGEYPTPTTLELQTSSLVETYLRELSGLKGTKYAQKMRAALDDCSPDDIHRLAAHEEIGQIVVDMRKALDESGLRNKPMTKVRPWIKRQNSAGKRFAGSKQQIELALKILHALGEYPGLGTSTSSPKKEP